MKFKPWPDVKFDVLFLSIHSRSSPNWKEITVNLERKTAHLIGIAMTRKVIWPHDCGGEEAKLHTVEM